VRFNDQEPIAPSWSSVLRYAAPGILLATILLVPFFGKAYTIDDPFFLREAEHTWHDPLHPTAFEIVWNQEVPQRASTLLPGGPLVPFLLLPVVLGGGVEWIGHLIQQLLFWVGICATVALALRCGLSKREAMLAALLVVATPAVLGMAGTVMPDIPAMTFSTLAVERLIAWKQQGRWHQGLMATLWMTAAPLTRSHLILLTGPALLLLVDLPAIRERRPWIGSFLRASAPVWIVPPLVALVLLITRDPDSSGGNVITAVQTHRSGLFAFNHNVLAFFGHWVLAIPLALPWAILRGRKLPWRTLWILIPTAIVVLMTRRWWMAFVVTLSMLVLTDILLLAWREKNQTKLFLGAYLFMALPIAFYVHLPSKYLIASAPGAAILVVGLFSAAPRRRVAAVFAAALCVGTLVGVLVVRADARMAGSMRDAAAQLIAPRIAAGQHVWYVGQWGFRWYAEQAGARPLTYTPPFPRPGDIIVFSRAGGAGAIKIIAKRRLLQVVSDTTPGGRIMDLKSGAGFFSTYWGYLPWSWGSNETNHFEVWQVE